MSEQRRQFVALYQTGTYTKARLCDLFGISRPTGDRWLARYAPDDPTWVADRSHAPHQCPHATAPAVVAAVLAVRQAHPTWGPKKIRAHLRRTQPALACPAASTIGALLTTAALVPAPTRRAQPPAWPSATLTAPTAPNTVWCADFMGWFRLGDGTRCDPITVTDGFSRYLLACAVACQPTGADVRAVCERLFRAHGLPAVIRTDNGAPFASTAIGGLSRLSVWWIKLGIRPERIPPGRPQYNGRHERLHATLQGDTRPAADPAAQQAAYDRFRREYNLIRPHEALGQVPPATIYTPSPRPYPETLAPVVYPMRMAVRTVRHNGCVKWQGLDLFVSEALAGEPIGWDPLDDRLWVVYFADVPLTVWDARAQRWLSRPKVRTVLATRER